MQPVSNEALIEKAKSVTSSRRIRDFEVGQVGSALITDQGNIYLGVCMDISSGIGFCAEHSAIAAMVTAGESRIRKLAAISADGKLMPPCGRCRELLYQIDRGNLETEVILEAGRPTRLADLLPHRWQDLWA